MKLWQRYFIIETLNIFLLFAGTFFLFYMLVDYSVHSKTFANAGVSFSQVVGYYGSQLSKRLEILIPFALMVSATKVLTALNQRNELVALLAAGTSIYRLMTPFLVLSVACAATLYANFEWIFPRAVSYVNSFEDTYLRHMKHKGKATLQVLRLTDNSHVVYGSYDSSTQSIEDAYWLRPPGEIYRIGQLLPKEEPPFARDVEILQRNSNGAIERVSAHEELALEAMRFDDKSLSAALVAPPSLALSALIERFPKLGRPLSDNEAAIVTHLYSKLALPLLCLLVIIGPAPSCLRFGRHLPVFFIYCIGIVGFLTFLATMNAAIILGEHQVMKPLFAVWGPVLLALGITGWRFARLTGA